MSEDLLAMLGIYGGTFAVAILSGLVPFVNAELFLIALLKLGVDSPAQLPVIVVATAVGQMVAKIGLYYAGRGLLELPRGRYKAKIEQVRGKLETWKSKPYYIYGMSSVFGLPPFYLTVLAAGAMKIRFPAFLWIGLVGRLIRFAVLVAVAWSTWR